MILTQNHRMEQIRSQHYNLLRFGTQQIEHANYEYNTRQCLDRSCDY